MPDKAVKRTSRYLEMLQRIPAAEKGCRNRYFIMQRAGSGRRTKLPMGSRITPWSRIPNAGPCRPAKTMMGAPITAQGYRCFPLETARTRRGLLRRPPGLSASRPWTQGRDYLRSQSVPSKPFVLSGKEFTMDFRNCPFCYRIKPDCDCKKGGIYAENTLHRTQTHSV